MLSKWSKIKYTGEEICAEKKFDVKNILSLREYRNFGVGIFFSESHGTIHTHSQ